MDTVKRIAITGLWLAAIFALGGPIASAAQAQDPEWAACVAQKHGNYTEAGCRTVAERNGTPDHRGHYEVADSARFTSQGGASVLYAEGVGMCREGLGFECSELIEDIPVRVECKSETGSGEASGAKEVRNVSMEFHQCSDPVYSYGECESAGAGPGDIQVDELRGELGYIEKATKEVGLLLTPAAGAGSTFAAFECGTGTRRLAMAVGESDDSGHNGVIAPITPVNTLTSEFEQAYTYHREPLRNIPERFEGGQLEALEMMRLSCPGEEVDGWTCEALPAAAETLVSKDTLVAGDAEVKT